MSNKVLQDLLSDPEKKTNETNNGLARLFRTILYDLNVEWSRLNRDIGRYFDRQQHEVQRSTKEQIRERGNLVKELCGDALTWKNFVKGIQVLNPLSMEIQITLKWRKGIETVHTVNINVANVNCSDEDDEVETNEE